MYVCIHESSVILWATAANVYNDGPLGDGDSCPKGRESYLYDAFIFALCSSHASYTGLVQHTYFAFSFLEKRYIIAEEPPASFHDSSMT